MRDFDDFRITAGIWSLIFTLASLTVLVMGRMSLTYAGLGISLGLADYFSVMFNQSKVFLIVGIILGVLGAISLITSIAISIANFIANR